MLFLWLNFLCGSTYAGNLGFGGMVRGARMYSLNQTNGLFPDYDAAFWPTVGLRMRLGSGKGLLEQFLLNANVGYIDRSFRTRGVSLGSEIDVVLGEQHDPDKVYNRFYVGAGGHYFSLERKVDGIQQTSIGSQNILLTSHGSGWSGGLVMGLENRPSESFGFDLAIEIWGSGGVPMKLTEHPNGLDYREAERIVPVNGFAARAGLIIYPFQSKEDTIWTRPLK